MISNKGGRNQNASKYASLYTFNGSPLCLYFPVERRALKEDDEFFHKQTKKLEKVRVNLEDFVESRSGLFCSAQRLEQGRKVFHVRYVQVQVRFMSFLMVFQTGN